MAIKSLICHIFQIPKCFLGALLTIGGPVDSAKSLKKNETEKRRNHRQKSSKPALIL
jgi:hypothetical protein